MIISPLIILYFFLCLFLNQLPLFIIIISTILLHEFGHYLMIKLFKGKVKKFTLSIVGGIMDVDLDTNLYTRQYYLSRALVAVGRHRCQWINYHNR